MKEQKISKTNAVRILDRNGVKYELVPYEVDENDLSAVHVAEQLGEDIRMVYKTLVLRGDRNGVFVCVVPGAESVDLKKAAKASGNKNCEMVAMKEILGLTGYIRGGCSPLGMKKDYPTYYDKSIEGLDEVYVSAGVRGLQVKVKVGELVRVTKGEVKEVV